MGLNRMAELSTSNWCFGVYPSRSESRHRHSGSGSSGWRGFALVDWRKFRVPVQLSSFRWGSLWSLATCLGSRPRQHSDWISSWFWFPHSGLYWLRRKHCRWGNGFSSEPAGPFSCRDGSRIRSFRWSLYDSFCGHSGKHASTGSTIWRGLPGTSVCAFGSDARDLCGISTASSHCGSATRQQWRSVQSDRKRHTFHRSLATCGLCDQVLWESDSNDYRIGWWW